MPEHLRALHLRGVLVEVQQHLALEGLVECVVVLKSRLLQEERPEQLVLVDVGAGLEQPL